MKKLLSLIALAGIFVACQPEELKTAFEVGDAQVTIDVNTVDVRTGKAVDATVTGSIGETSGKVITISGKPSVPAQTVTVTAKYKADYMSKEAEYKADVKVAALRAGGKAEYSVNIVVGEPDPVQGYSFRVVAGDPKTAVTTTYFTPADGHALVDHAGEQWAKNLSEYLLQGTVTYTVKLGSKVPVSTFDAEAAGAIEFKDVFDSYVDAFDTGVTETPASLDIVVSAYSYYTAWQTVTKVTTDYTVYKHNVADADNTKDVAIGEFEVESYQSTQAEYKEIANPEGHGHYIYGHGHSHGHGEGGNAGGGIVLPE